MYPNYYDSELYHENINSNSDKDIFKRTLYISTIYTIGILIINYFK